MPARVTIAKNDRATGRRTVVDHAEANEIAVRDGHLYVSVINSHVAAIYAPGQWESAEANFA